MELVLQHVRQGLITIEQPESNDVLAAEVGCRKDAGVEALSQLSLERIYEPLRHRLFLHGGGNLFTLITGSSSSTLSAISGVRLGQTRKSSLWR